MGIFNTTIQQMLFLFTLILLGYILKKGNFIPSSTATALSKLENYLFIPALVLNTFIQNFTVSKLQTTGSVFLFSFVLLLVMIILSLVSVRFITKDTYVRKICLYGLCFSNFSFMGNAIVGALFPDVLFDYIVFTLVLWAVIYLWGAPALLMGDDEQKGILASLKKLINPMFACMLVGMLIGLTGIPVPPFATSAITALSNCMSPLAMIITGITIAKIDIKAVLKVKTVYLVSLLRLIIYPLLFIGIYYLLPIDLPRNLLVCAVVSLAMPLGLNTIVIPAAYGKDTTVASGMALISHILSVITLPLIFMLM